MQCSSPRASAGLSRFEASIAPSALPAPTSVCISSMNRMMPPSDDVTSCSTALSRSSNSPRYFAPAISAPMSSASSFLSLQALRHVAVDDALRQALDDRGLADAGLADQHRIVLGAARQHLDGAADLLVAADHRIDLAVARGLGEVAGVFLERVIGVLGRADIGGAALAQRLDRGVEVLRRDAGRLRILPASLSFSSASASSSRSTVTKLSPALSATFSAVVEHARQRRLEIELAGAAARTLGRLASAASTAASASREWPPERSISPAASPSGSSSSTLSRCSVRELLVPLAQGKRLRRLHETAGAVGVFSKFIRNSPAPSAQAARLGASW